jgi:ABC-2 type transport system permease protein
LILSAVICLALVLCGFPPATNFLSQMTDAAWVVHLLAAFSFITHFEYFTKGVVELQDVVFFLCVIGFSLFTTGVVIRSHRAG